MNTKVCVAKEIQFSPKQVLRESLFKNKAAPKPGAASYLW
jgi:hypothetical protein